MSIDNKDENLYHSIHENGLDDHVADGSYSTEGSDEESSNRMSKEQQYEVKRTRGKLCKNGCGVWIFLKKDRTGKWQPHNQNDNEFHRCSKKPSKYKCYDCGNKITFDRDKLSDSGKPIPLNASDFSPHQCPNDPFNARQ